MTVAGSDPTEARKRRKEIIQSQRSENDGNAASNNESVAPAVDAKNTPAATVVDAKNTLAVATESATAKTAAATEKKPPKKRKISGEKAASKKDEDDDEEDDDDDDDKKTQIRYDPDVPMSKEQLAAWRREARRVRNRESAAASRQRIRSRITELEDELGEWKTKYHTAMERLDRLEQLVGETDDSSNKA
jgi:hypothetical protein